ncbi:ATP-binding protein [Radiobacillus sp. PE A8.2]|uniref:ATP-binding protein n=1 Tax=Radiobacillus sp. PE A8.2 TaxID=3380349 RepID=UPI0038907DA2
MKTFVLELLPYLQIYFPLWFISHVFLMPLRHKDLFYLRFIVIIFLYILASYLSVKFSFNEFILILIDYMLACSVFIFLTESKWKENVYCTIWSVITSKLMVEILLFLRTITGNTELLTSLMQIVIFFVFVITFGSIVGFTIARTMPDESGYHIGPRQFISAGSLAIIFEILTYILYQNHFKNENLFYFGLILISQVYCVTVLYLQHALFNKSAIQQELEKINYLWYHQRSQYNLTKENIALINQKSHDLKHQLAAFRKMSKTEGIEEYLKEIENTVDIYESIVRTDNEAMDIILTEKSLYGQSHGIHINCVVDGKKMKFLAPIDIYTIFGNALDNAIESVMNISDRSKRFIDVIIYAKGQFLIINVINPLEETLKFENGFPISTKPQNGYHGFGLKSIRHTIQKYQGYVTIETKNNCFNLCIVIPFPK